MQGSGLSRESCLRITLGLVLGLVTLAASAAESATASAAEKPAAAPAASEKVLKYHKMLVGRPEPGYLFDRFYNTWLDDSTVDSLETFLRQQVDASQKTPDRLLLALFYAKQGG